MELLKLEEVKIWLRIEGDEEDILLQTIMQAAESYLLTATGRRFGIDDKLATLFCLILVADWYENRQMNNFRVGEKTRFIIDSMLIQLTYGAEGGVEQ